MINDVKPENRVNQRAVPGINRTDSARLTAQGFWFATQNLYAKMPGQLGVRPGSACLVVGLSGAQIIQPAQADSAAGGGGLTVGNMTPGEYSPFNRTAGLSKVADFTSLASQTNPMSNPAGTSAIGLPAANPALPTTTISNVGVRQIRPGSISAGFKR